MKRSIIYFVNRFSNGVRVHIDYWAKTEPTEQIRREK